MVRHDLQLDGRYTSAADVSNIGRDVRNAWATRNAIRWSPMTCPQQHKALTAYCDEIMSAGHDGRRGTNIQASARSRFPEPRASRAFGADPKVVQ